MNNLYELSNLMNDSLSGKVGLFAADADKYTDQAIREAFFNILGDDKLTWQNWRAHKNEIFAVMEEVLRVNLPAAWENSPFYDEFVEIRRGDLGDTNEFYVEDNSILYVSKFSGNHWDTDRQKLQGKKAFAVTTDWYYVRVYEELERFLKNITNLQEMMDKLDKAFQNEIDSHVFAAFNSIGTYMPAQFQVSGDYDKASMNDLIQRVQIASQKDVVLAGTRTALGYVADGMSAAWISESAKQELATTGMVIENIGLPCRVMAIPQTFLRGTYDFKVDNNTLYVLPEGTKPIKLFYEGDVRALDLTPQDTGDQVYDSQIQLKCGCGVICDSLIGKYTIE